MRLNAVTLRNLSLEPGGPDLDQTLREDLRLAPSESLPPYEILRRSIDARRKGRIRIVYSLRIGGESEEIPPPPPDILHRSIGRSPVVVGAGPAGLFSALALAEKGYRPLVVDRGTPLAIRVPDVAGLRRNGTLKPESNILFGEGGAGTFSDGKLTHRSKHRLVRQVFAAFVEAGASPEILYEQKPHVGTDRLRAVVTRLRQRIEAEGGSFLFGTRLEDVEIIDGCIRAVRLGTERVETDSLFLACGHSARDTYRLLLSRGIALETKAFAVGLRIEHDQGLIDHAQYGILAGHPELGAADYRLSWTDPASKRGVYSFCNCPGGTVVPAMHQPATVNTNGMSWHARDTGRSNSALVVTVPVDDFHRGSPLDGIAYQEALEKAAFEAGGGNCVAPAQTTRDFLQRRVSRKLPPSSYGPGIAPADLARLLPHPVARSLARAIPVFCKRIRGFDESLLVGIETRTSSPVRILRDRETMESLNVRGLFPVGEGSGYSGGIVSSAVDALRAVQRIREYHA